VGGSPTPPAVVVVASTVATTLATIEPSADRTTPLSKFSAEMVAPELSVAFNFK
jgi:hypothetical protein